MAQHHLQVINPKRLGADRIPAELIELPDSGDYKPNIGVMPDGRLVMFALHQHQEAKHTGGSYTNHTVMYTSDDQGRTWSRGRHMKFFGHEPSVTVIDGVIYVLTHFLSNETHDWEAMADADYTHDMLYRSTDGGGTWQETPLTYDRFEGAQKASMVHTRNIHKLPDGRLFLGMSVGTLDFACYSTDRGVTWKTQRASIGGYSYTDNYPFGVFAESVVFDSPSGRLMMLSRMDLALARFDRPLPFAQPMAKKTGVDHFEGEVLFESPDNGLSWKPLRAVGFPALMYPGVVQLPDGRLLVNYTVREVPPEGTGSVHPRIGVQAVFAEEKADGTLDFAMSEDVIVIDDRTNPNLTSGGGFGRTVRLADGTLVTPYSYLWADDDVIRMAENGDYLKREIFDKYGAMSVNPITYESCSSSKEFLRVCFAVIWGFHGLMKKAGIRTAVVRWRLPG